MLVQLCTYVERLRTILFDEDWVLKADYRVEKQEDSSWMCLRTVEQAVNGEFEDISDWAAPIEL